MSVQQVGQLERYTYCLMNNPKMWSCRSFPSLHCDNDILHLQVPILHNSYDSNVLHPNRCGQDERKPLS